MNANQLQAMMRRAESIVGGDVDAVLPPEIVRAFDRCRHYLCASRGDLPENYGLFDAKADLWKLTAFCTVAFAHVAASQEKGRGEGEWIEALDRDIAALDSAAESESRCNCVNAAAATSKLRADAAVVREIREALPRLLELGRVLREYFDETPAILGGPGYQQKIADQRARHRRLEQLIALLPETTEAGSPT